MQNQSIKFQKDHPKKTPLREKAEKQLAKSTGKLHSVPSSPTELKKLAHELQVHEIELEMQNEQLLQTVHELDEAKQRYYELYDFAPVGYFVFDTKGKIIDANLTGCNLLGGEKSNILGRQFQLFLAPECRKEFNKFCSNVLTHGRIQRCELNLQRDKNKTVYLLLEGAIINETDNIKVTATDITERKLTEIERDRAINELEKLKINLEQLVHERTQNLENANREILLLAQAISSTNESVCITDSKKRILFVNIAFVHTYGYGAKEILGKRIDPLCANKSAPNNCYEIFTKAVKQNWKGEVLQRKKNGDVFPAEVSIAPLRNDEGEITAFIVLTSDITERKKAEEEILKSHREQNLIFQSVPVVLYNAVAGSRYDALWISENVKQITGFTANQFLTQPDFWKERIHPDDREWVLKDFQSIPDRKFIHTEYRWLCADNTYRWFIEQGILPDLQDDGQKIIYGAWVDITDRKLAAEAVERSEKHFRALIENSSDMIVLIDNEGFIKYTSPSTERVMGYRFEEVQGIDIFKLVHPEDLQKAREIFNQSLEFQKLVIHMDIRALHKNGTWRWVKCSGVNLLHDQNVSGIVCNISDITARKWAEEMLINAHNALQATTRAIPDLLFTINRQGTFLDYHTGSEDLLYAQPHKFMGKNVSDVLPPEVAKLSHQAINAVLEKKDIFTFEYQLTIRDETKEFEARAVFKDDNEVIFFVRDISDRKRVVEALVASERKYRDIFTYAPVGIYQSTKDGKFIAANLRLAQILGYDSVDEIMKLNMGEDVYFNKGERDTLIAKYEPGGSVSDIEVRWRKKDGSPIWISLTSHAIKDTNKQTLYFEGFVRDLTEQKLARNELHKSENKYQQLISNISDAIIVDDIEGRVRYANQNFFNLFGIPEKNLGKIVIEDYVSPKWRAELRERHNRRMAGEDVASHFEYEGTGADGSRLWLEVSVVKIMDGEKIVGTQSAIRNITERKMTDIRLREVMNRLIETEERMRKSAAQQLHDEVGQNLTALSINLNFINSLLTPPSKDKIEKRLNDSITLLEKTIECTRDIMVELRPPVLDDYGLNSAIMFSLDKFKERTNLEVNYSGSDLMERLPSNVEHAIFRTSQEALTNIIKHAHAKSITVRFEEINNLVMLSVQDDGVGFDTENIKSDKAKGHLGLATMTERIESLGGKLIIASTPGHGTKITIEVER